MDNKEQYIKNKIEKALGKSDKFTIDDAINYFIKVYGAKEIPPQFAINYRTKYYLSEESRKYWENQGWLTEDITRGVMETYFYHRNEYARALLLDESCLRKAIKNYDEIIAKQDKSALESMKRNVGPGTEWRENSIIILTTANGKKILNFEYEGVGINIDLELCYICEHTIGGSEWHNYYGYDSYRFEEEAEM